MAVGTLNLAANFQLPGAAPQGNRGPGANLFQLGMSLGMALGQASDGFSGSDGLGDFGGGPMGGAPLGGLSGGFGNPMMGMPQMGQMNPQLMQALGQLLGSLVGSMAGQGSQGPCMGCQGGFPGQGCQGAGFPGQGFPGMGGMGGPAGMNPMMGMGQPQGGGQTVELQKGDSFTTPGGATIDWQGDEVKVSEPGGSGQNQRGFGGGNSTNMAAAFSGPGFQASLAMSVAGVPGPIGGACQQAGQDAQPRDWRVWGDPHIDHPNGEKSDFETKNSMFTLQDGSQVLMGADNPKGVVNKVQIVLPGGQPNWDGIDPSQTTLMQDNGQGKFESAGTADQFMQGGFAGIPGYV